MFVIVIFSIESNFHAIEQRRQFEGTEAMSPHF